MPVVLRLTFDVLNEDFGAFWSNFYAEIKARSSEKGGVPIIGNVKNHEPWNWILIGVRNSNSEICLLIRAETLYFYGWRQGSSDDNNKNTFFIVKDEIIQDVPGEFRRLDFTGNYNKLPDLEKIIISRGTVSRAVDSLFQCTDRKLHIRVKESFLTFILLFCASLRVVSIRECITEAFKAGDGVRIDKIMKLQEQHWSHASDAFIGGELIDIEGFGVITEENAPLMISLALWMAGKNYKNIPSIPGWGPQQRHLRDGSGGQRHKGNKGQHGEHSGHARQGPNMPHGHHGRHVDQRPERHHGRQHVDWDHKDVRIKKDSGLLSIILEHLRRIPDLERLLDQVKSAVGSSAVLLLPMIGPKMLRRRVKTYGSLVKGLRMGMNLFNVLHREDHGVPSLSKVVNIPTLKSLDEFVKQFEEALDYDFPKYQDHDVKDSHADTLSFLTELFVEKSTERSQVINTLSTIDSLQSFPGVAVTSWSRTSWSVFVLHTWASGFSCEDMGRLLKMKGLWHPAGADNASGLVPNDVHLGDYDGSNNCALLLTGPNMGGKSTLMLPTCLSIILAQLGCYVPCESCELSPADIIFTRLGATDRIMAREKNTFMLRNATQDSLVLPDELRRGTSTFDGNALAYDVLLVRWSS